MKLYNLNSIPTDFVSTFTKNAQTRRLSELAGGERLCVNLDVVPPGCLSAKYHAHTLQEEFFLIVSGHGKVRTPEGELPVKEGDFLAKPAGLENAHTFFNSGDAPLHILDVSTVADGDVAYYPDEDVYYLRGGGPAFAGGAALADWTPEPDGE